MHNNHGCLLLLNLNHIGDILFTTPAIRALKENFPDARIRNVVLSGMEDLLNHNPCVDEVLTRKRGPLSIIKMIPKVRAGGCDTSVLFTFSSVRMAALGKWAGATTRVGFDEPGLTRFLTHPVSRRPGCHRVDWYLDLVRTIGADVRNPKMEMFTSKEEREFAADLLESVGITKDRPTVAISPGSSVAAKQWFPDRYAALADRLASDGLNVLIVGSASERETVDEVMRKAKNPPIDIAGRTKIGQLAAVLEKCDAVVSNDTGPMHLAVSVGTPVVAIFGPTDPRITGPYCDKSKVLWEQLSCAPCGHKPTCGDFKCLQAITVDRAFDAASELISQRRKEK
ncbi:MAG: glycosyltransferase family 9 protein [Armatimonadota bacterium]